MISVLLPSRGRPASLAASVASLDGHADDPARVEILVAADPDDPVTASAAVRGPSVMWTAPRRYGYTGLHEYVNRLAALASGDWLMLWNDDALMLTSGWDTVICASRPAVLWPAANHTEHCNLFPVWPRAWTDATGHVALCWNCDSWMQMVGQMAGRQDHIPVEVLHDRANVTGGHDDVTADEGWRVAYGDGVNRFWDADMTAARSADGAVIQGLLA